MSTATRVLVTGAAGFIGSHIVHGLVDKGFEVLALDDLSTGKSSNLPASVELRKVDIRSADDVYAAFADFKPQVVSHHAAQTSVSISVREPVADAEVNVIGGLNVLRAAIDCGCERFVFASTGGAMYGEVPSGKAVDVGAPPAPTSPYACSKFAFEGYLKGLSEGTSMSWSILRYANVYGPRQDPHGEAGVVAIFAKRLLNDQALTLFAREKPGDGGCERDYVYVSDVVRVHELACRGELDGRITHVATGIGTSTQAIAEKLASALGARLELQQADPRPGDLMRSVLEPASGEAAGRVTLDQGLRETARWFREHGD